MATARPFAFNPGAPIAGTEQVGQIAVGITSQDYVGGRAGFNTKAPLQYVNFTNGTASDVNATQPFTWTNTDRFIWNGSYEIA